MISIAVMEKCHSGFHNATEQGQGSPCSFCLTVRASLTGFPFFCSNICCSCFMETPSESKAKGREGHVTTRKSRRPFVCRLSDGPLRGKLGITELCYKKNIRSSKSERNVKQNLCLPCHLPGDKNLLHLWTQSLDFLISHSRASSSQENLGGVRPGAGPCSASLQSGLTSGAAMVLH